MMIFKKTPCVSLGILLLSVALAVGAAVPVTNTNDNLVGSLRRAIQDASPGDTVVFQIPTNDAGYNPATAVFTITLTSKELTVDKDLTIDGGNTKIGVSGDQKFTVFNITAGKVAISRLTITRGQSGVLGAGGIQNAGELTLSECTLNGNIGVGSALNVLSGASATVNNCTFRSNQGGAAIRNAGTLALWNSTLTGNSTSSTATSGGGVLNEGIARVRSTIIADNSGLGQRSDVAGNFVSEGYNFVGVGSGSTGFGGPGSRDQVGTLGSPADPKLGEFQDNGGPTATMRPLVGSPVTDQGNRGPDHAGLPINSDQRGAARPVDQPGIGNASGGDGSDIGAVELGVPQTSPAFTVTTTADHDDGACTTDHCTFVEALNATNANPNADTIGFAANVTGRINRAASGLFITNPVAINGPGARILAIGWAGRGFIVQSENVSISGLTLRDAVSAFDGGAIHNSGGLMLTDCTLTNNRTTTGTSSPSGGGVSNAPGATLTMLRCTVSANTANYGGGVQNAGIFSATNCTFSGNTARSGGGGISISSSGTSDRFALRNCTITRCTAAFGGGIDASFGDRSRILLGNSIIAGNTAGVLETSDIRGDFTSEGHNFIGKVGTSHGFTNGAKGDQVGSGAGIDPKLDPTLKNSGGPTDTHALLSESTAINAGDDALAPLKDQRGYSRSGVSDIGAFEFNGFAMGAPPTVTTGAATNITSTTATLNVTINPNGLSTAFHFSSRFGSSPDQFAGAGTTAVSFTYDVTGLSPNTQYRFNTTATNSAGTTQGVEQTFTTLPATTLGNISTRLRVETGDNVLIGGFIVTGTEPKKVIVRGTGPSLPFADRLQDPTLELRDSSGALLESNDNWVDSPNKQAIIDSTIPPSHDLEPAIVATLPANNSGYTAIVRGVNNGTGLGVVEAYDLDNTVDSKLANISTRGLVQTGDNVLIAGTIVVGPSSQKVIVRAIAPSLTIPAKMEDPTLELRDANGGLLGANDNWRSDQEAEIIATTIPPSHDLEAAIVVTLPANNSGYTAIVRGAGNTTGIAVVEVYALN